jgi:sulfite reductase beta subunit-like hemoprotein
MGVTHGNKKTYPRIGSLIGFCTPEQGKYVAEKVMLVQRDHGNRDEWVSYFNEEIIILTSNWFFPVVAR